MRLLHELNALLIELNFLVVNKAPWNKYVRTCVEKKKEKKLKFIIKNTRFVEFSKRNVNYNIIKCFEKMKRN